MDKLSCLTLLQNGDSLSYSDFIRQSMNHSILFPVTLAIPIINGLLNDYFVPRFKFLHV